LAVKTVFNQEQYFFLLRTQSGRILEYYPDPKIRLRFMRECCDQVQQLLRDCDLFADAFKVYNQRYEPLAVSDDIKRTKKKHKSIIDKANRFSYEQVLKVDEMDKQLFRRKRRK